MSEPYTPSQNSGNSRGRLYLIGGFIALALTILVVVIGFFAVRYGGYRNSSGRILESGFPQIAISNPTDRAVVPVGIPINITAAAVGYDPFMSAELLLDGKLVGVEAGPSGGLTPFNAVFTWIPSEPGVHQLITRAHDSESNTASSAAVLIIVLPDEILTDAEAALAENVQTTTEAAAGEGSDGEVTSGESAGSGGGEGTDASGGSVGGEGNAGGGPSAIVYPAAPGESGQAPTPPGSNDSVGSSQPWTGSPGNWINSITAQAKPNAPQLVGAPGRCGAELSIQDNTDNEEGFRVFRMGLNSPGWSEVVQIASQSQNDWIMFADSGISGPVNYYVSAFNSQGVSDSNIVLVDIPAIDCPGPVEDSLILTIAIDDIVLAQSGQQAYCYQSLGGAIWTRLLEFGFITSGDNGLQLNDAVQQILLNDGAGQMPVDTLDIYFECWGWSGSVLHSLGDFVHSIDLSAPSGSDVDFEGLSVSMIVDISKQSEPLYGVFEEQIALRDKSTFLIPFLAYDIDLLAVEPHEWRMPFVSAWLTYEPDDCTAHLEPEAQNFLGSLVLCQPYPGHNIGPGGANPQPYVVWQVDENSCTAKYYGAECLNLNWWTAYANTNGGTLGWTVASQSPNFTNAVALVDKIFRSAWLPNPLFPGCEDGLASWQVQMTYIDQVNGSFVGNPSNPVDVPCGTTLGDTVTIEVSFETLHLNGLDDDGTGPGDDVEVFGRFEAHPSSWPSKPGRVVVGHQPLNVNECVNWEALFPGPGSAGPENFAGYCMNRMEAGSYPLANEALCVVQPEALATLGSSEDLDFCPFTVGKGNNSLFLSVHNGDSIKIRSQLIDDDVGSSDDPVCITSLWTEPKSHLQWAQTTNEPRQLVALHDEANCTLDVVLNAVTQ